MAGGKRKRDSIHETPDVSYITNPDVAHEHTDVPVTPVLKFIAGLVIFAIVMHLAMYAAFKFFEAREIAAERQSSPLARTPQESLPPEPRLQLAPGFEVKTEDGQAIDLSYQAVREGGLPAPQSEYWTVQKEWKRKLENYTWADRQAGAVRLPIDEAIRRYAEQQKAAPAGQPTAPGQAAPPPGPSPSAPAEHTPAPSSSGRTTEQKHQ